MISGPGGSNNKINMFISIGGKLHRRTNLAKKLFARDNKLQQYVFPGRAFRRKKIAKPFLIGCYLDSEESHVVKT